VSELVVPRLGVAVTEVTIVEWLVDDGQAVTVGQPILLVATDKTEVEIEAAASGILTHGAEPEGEYPVGAVIGHIA
jgi:pyruvate/2-oxoglutarate dehydrogenase complex dihydrolipoamide acyltransferase (E2) component